nr:CAP domain-containing protein [Amycolatopsis nigrescens]
MPSLSRRRQSQLVVLSVLAGVGLAAGGYLVTRPSTTTPVMAVAAATPAPAWAATPLGSMTGVPALPSQSIPPLTPPPVSSSTAPASSTSAPVTSTEKPKPSTEPPKPKAASAPPSAAGEVLTLVNKARAEAGCSPVSTDARLVTAAQKHSDDMAARDYFSHTTPEGVSFAERIREAGYGKPGAENIAKGQATAAQVMSSWMNSDGHRRNILNCSLGKLGVGVNTAGRLWTQDFGY